MTTSTARIEIRVQPQIKDAIEQAAAMMGQSLSQFSVATLLERAQTVIRTDQVTRLSQRDAQQFVDLLDAGGKPNRKLSQAAKRYKRLHDR